MDDNPNPTVEEIVDRLSKFWLPDESILYIGQTTRQTLKARVNQYYKTCLGHPRPHAGGHWIKTLSILDKTFVHYADCDNPKSTEDALISHFVSGISSDTKKLLFDSEHPFPFANLEFPKGNRKKHGITGSRLPR